jgi:hypothetical protein
MRYLVAVVTCLMSVNSLVAAEQYAAHFTGKSCIEIRDSAGMLDLNSDFTIEVCAKWRASELLECIAGDEAWTEMSPEVKVAEECGWTLRKVRSKGRDVLEFNVGTDHGWLGLQSRVPKQQETWTHIAICRRENMLVLYVDGKRQTSAYVKGKRLIKSPTSLFLGVRHHAHADRKFDGFVRNLRVSSVARYTTSYTPSESFTSDDDTLVLYDFAEDSKDSIQDQSSHNRNGVLNQVELVPLTR